MSPFRFVTSGDSCLTGRRPMTKPRLVMVNVRLQRTSPMKYQVLNQRNTHVSLISIMDEVLQLTN